MKYKFSKFLITAKDKSDIYIYSTLTTSIIKIPSEFFYNLYLHNRFDDYPEIVEKLKHMGILIALDFDENLYLADIRKKSMQELNNVGTPYYLITPTMDCNARCYYCFEQGSHHEKMSLETADNVVAFINKNAPDKDIIIQWFGGEPLLAIDIIEYISMQLTNLGFSIKSKITTNGYLLTPDVISTAINNWGTDVIQITLDGLNDDYNRVKNYIGSAHDTAFNVVINNVQHVLDSGIKMRIRINYNPLDLNPAKNIISFLYERFNEYSNLYVYFAPIDSKAIPSITNTFEQLKEHPLITMLDFKKGFAGMAQSNRGITDQYELILNKYYLHPISLSCTGVCNRNITIDSLGDIYVCHRLLGKGKEYSSGDVVNGLINNSIRLYYQSTDLPDEKCEYCNLLPLCQGGCKFRRINYSAEKSCLTVKGAVTQLLLRAIEEMKSIND